MSGLEPRHFARFVEESSLQSWITDQHGRMLYANGAARRALDAMTGRAFVAGTPTSELYPPDLAVLCAESDRRVLDTNGAVETLEPGLRADGTAAKLLVRKYPIGDHDGVRLIGGIAVDITDKIRSELQLRAAEERFAKIVEIAREGVWWVDREFNTTFVNSAMAAMIGYGTADLLGKKSLDFVEPEARRELLARRENRKQGYFETLETPLVRKDGSICWTSSTSIPLLDDEGRFAGAVGLVTDISEKKRIDAQLRETQKLESLGLLAGGIAHDFNNLLAGIIGNLDVVRRDVPDEATTAQNSLRLAKEAALRAAALTRQLLAYAGKQPLAKQPIDVAELVRSTIHLLGNARTRVDVVVQGPPPRVDADEVQLRQVVMNLVLNAVEALADDRARVRVTIREDDVHRSFLDACVLGAEHAEGRYVALEVKDEGGGMDAETARRVFEPFFTTKEDGRGLGLSATLGILRSHGAALRLATAPDAGTTFTLLLPPTGAPEAAITEPEIEPAERLHTILLVDDDKAVRHAAARLLEVSGYNVLDAASGPEAIAIYRMRRAEIAAVVLDSRMPGMDGEATYAELVAIDPDVHVIICSGFLEPEVASRLAAKGVFAFVTKPFEAASFLDILKSALRVRA